MSDKVLGVRKKIDALDNSIHDLLMERADLVLKIGEEKRKHNIQVIQPDREAVMIRRLLARHKGPLPQEAVVRIWRELVGAVSLLQTGLKVAVTVADQSDGLMCWDMAKDYFSSVLPMQRTGNALATLAAVREGEATFGVMPRPVDNDPAPWWRFLMDDGAEKPLRIMARLPLGDRSNTGVNPEHKALAIARLKFEPSGDDRSFIALDLDSGISRTRLIDRLRGLEMTARSIYSSPRQDGGRTLHLAEVDGYVAGDDARLERLVAALEDADNPGGGNRAVCIGGYPTPPVYDDKVGKNADGNKGNE